MAHLPPARPVLCAALSLLLGAPAASAADPAPARVEVRAAQGPARRGVFLALGATSLKLQQDQAPAPVEVPLAGLREARFSTAAAAPATDRLRVTLVGGETLLAESHAPAPDGIELGSRSFGRLRVPFDVVRSIEALPAQAGACHEPAGRVPPTPGADRVALVGGDELSGTVLEATLEGLRVELERGRERLVAWTELLVAQLDNPAPAPRAQAGTRTEVETLDGDVLWSAAAPTGDVADGLTLALGSDAGLLARVPTERLRTVRWRGGACVDATALAFRSTYVPLLAPTAGTLAADFLARERGARVGRRPRGCPLRLDGTTYVHGFAVHSGSTITLPLDGAFRSFDVLVGIDDEAEEEGRGRVPVPGDVDVRVLGDGKVLWQAKGIAGLEAARSVGPLDVSGVKELVLAVDYGGHDDVLDRVTWADPVLTR